MQLRVACIGAGYFSAFHYDAWRRLDDAILVGAADTDLTKAVATGAPAFETLNEMLAAVQPNVLDIITPPPSHFAAIKEALEFGVKAIICQKPFCSSLNEAREACQLAAQANVPLIIHENFRFQPWYQCIKKEMSEGTIGEVQQITFRLRTGDGQGRDAYLARQPYFQTMPRLLVHETAVHWIDTFQFLLGDARAVYADLRRLNPAISGEDAGYILFDFCGGVRALFDGNRHLDHAAENHRLTLGEALVEGTSGTLTLSGDGAVRHRAFGATEDKILLASRDWSGFAGDCVYALQGHVLKGLLHGTPLQNTAADYLDVMIIEEAIYRSAHEWRKIEI